MLWIKTSTIDQSFARSHQKRGKFAGINAIASPTAHTVGNTCKKQRRKKKINLNSIDFWGHWNMELSLHITHYLQSFGKKHKIESIQSKRNYVLRIQSSRTIPHFIFVFACNFLASTTSIEYQAIIVLNDGITFYSVNRTTKQIN